MKINFDHIDLSFENIDGNDERLKRISRLIWKLLDDKFESDDDDNNSNNNNFSAGTKNKFNRITLDKIVVPPIHVDSTRSDYEIASRCASAIHQAVVTKQQ